MATADDQPCRPRPGTLRWAPQAQPGRGPLGHIGLLHGITSAATSWWQTAPLLAAGGWEATAVDLPGHGEGPRPTEEVVTMAGVAHDTAAVLPGHLDVLVGHSLGAVVALAVAAQHPGLTGGVVLIEPPSWQGLDTELLAVGAEAKGQMARDDPDGTASYLRGQHPDWDEDETRRTVTAWASTDSATVARAVRAGLSWDLAGSVAASAVPVMVIAAPEDGASFMTGGRSALTGTERALLAESLPAGRFWVVEGGHSLQREQPERVSELVLAFAGQLKGDS